MTRVILTVLILAFGMIPLELTLLVSLSTGTPQLSEKNKKERIYWRSFNGAFNQNSTAPRRWWSSQICDDKDP